MQQTRMNLPNDLVVLLNQLAQNGDIRMAARVLHVYIIRFWKVDGNVASQYVRKYFEKYHSKQLQRYLRMRKQAK